ncbi:helix-turn-helix domain-containing protein [Haladaptatus sp. SPP-AMP-3]|uniref:helix-turn-helix domain-containing protein n=1 Tax=Haladaptatus sp. SPP-AMP-3 TaxID=3121295 RepID=UPI003C2B78BE
MEIRGPDTDAIVRRFEDASEVRSYDVLHTDERSVLIRATTPVPEGYRANRASGTPPNYPARMQDGWLHTELSASHDRLSQFTDELHASDIPFQIQSLTQSHDSTERLTDRQQEFIVEAVERGYYDSPRGCTLTELAAAFDVNKSAASGVLHRAEGRIIKKFVASSVPDNEPNSEPE